MLTKKILAEIDERNLPQDAPCCSVVLPAKTRVAPIGVVRKSERRMHTEVCSSRVHCTCLKTKKNELSPTAIPGILPTFTGKKKSNAAKHVYFFEMVSADSLPAALACTSCDESSSLHRETSTEPSQPVTPSAWRDCRAGPDVRTSL